MASFKQAEIYNYTSSTQKEDGLELFQNLTLKRGMKILDLGCGTGYLSKIMSGLAGPESIVMAIDPDIERLHFAKENYSSSNLLYMEGSADDIPGFEYDLVYSSSVLHWVKDKDSVFKEVSKRLKQGGQFGFLCSTFSEMMDIVTEDTHSREFVQAARDSIHYASAESLARTATRAGFDVIRWGERSRTLFFDIHSLVRTYMMHFHQFDVSHFNYEALRRKLGTKEIKLAIKDAQFVLQKL